MASKARLKHFFSLKMCTTSKTFNFGDSSPHQDRPSYSPRTSSGGLRTPPGSTGLELGGTLGGGGEAARIKTFTSGTCLKGPCDAIQVFILNLC